VKLASDTSRLRLMIIHFEYGRADGCSVKREQLREVYALKRRQKISMVQGKEDANER
jgi:hypothetical protein